MAKYRKPPSRIRYEQNHPTLSFRLDLETKKRLENTLEGQSFADFIKEALGVKEKETRSLKEAYKNGYAEGNKEGHKKGSKDGHANGYAKGTKEGHKKGFEDGYAKGNKEGYKKGHQDGYANGYGKCSEEQRTLSQEAIKKAFEDGYAKPKKEFMITYNCARCGKPITITSEKAKKAVKEYMENDRWQHVTCD